MISVVTVNYKTRAYLERMLETLFQFHKEPLEVFVVDNASGDQLDDLSLRFPTVTFLRSEKNLGFAGGCNLAIGQAQGDDVVLVNPDVEFTSDAIFQIAKKMELDPTVGIGGIRLLNTDGSPQACVWRFPTPWSQLLLLLKIPHIFGETRSVGRWLMRDMHYEESQDVDQVMGAFFCIQRKLLDDIGLLDDKFFLWYEEVDFCRRAKNAGWRVRYFHDISARHKKGSSFLSVSTWRKQAFLRRSLSRYMRKHHGWLGWILFTLPEPLFILMAILASFLKPR